MIRRINAGNRIHFIPGIGIQVITPRGGAKWWLAGGIDPANCVAAYQPKGAVSEAASKVNLARPGTYDSSWDSGITWDTSYGWYFNTRYAVINHNYSPVSYQHSYFVRYTQPISTQTFLVYRGAVNKYVGFLLQPTSNLRFYNGQAGDAGILAPLSAVLGIVGSKLFIDGTDTLKAVSGSWTGDPGVNVRSASNGFPPNTPKIQAIAIYNTIISAIQAAAVSAAMAAL